jgi:hypothetical protein
MKLSSAQKQIHERAVVAAVKYQNAEAEMIRVLQDADRIKLHKSFGLSSLLKYAVQYLKLSEPVALGFISVARKSADLPPLNSAILKRRLSVATASRIVSTISAENADELIDFAATHTWRETEREIARRNPRAASPDKVKAIGRGLIQLTITVTEQEYKCFERVCSIEAQRKRKSPTRGQALVAAIESYLTKHDPVQRAERATLQKRSRPNASIGPRSQKYSVRTEQNVKIPNNLPETRKPLTAGQLHVVHQRDQGRCTHVNESGVRCNQDRWTQIHHIIPVSRGGTNDPSNLTTLCSFHHDLAHQLSFPIEGQITWLKALHAPYG